MQRGEIWWASFGDPESSEPGFRRPVVVMQSDEFNITPIRTVVVVSLTTNLRLAGAPGNVLCATRESGLPRESVINVSQTATVNKTRLTQRIGRLPGPVMRRVEAGLRLLLGL